MTSFGPNFLPPIAKGASKDAQPTMTKDPVLKRLQNHKFCRAVIRCIARKPVRRRVTVDKLSPDLKKDKQIRCHVKRTEDNLSVTLDSLRDEIDSMKNDPRMLVADRMSLRESFNKMDNCERWYRNKPIRSSFEDRYLRNCLAKHLKADIFGIGKHSDCKAAYNYFAERAKPGDKFVAQETLGLHIIDEFMLKNNEDLSQFLAALDRENTGTLEWSRVAEALRKGNVPLEDYQILQAMAVLQCYDGGKMNIKDFSEKMFDFRKYKWFRLLVNNDDCSENLLESLEDSKDTIIDHGHERIRRRWKTQPVLKLETPLKVYKVPLGPETCEKSPISEVESDWEVETKFWPGALLNKLKLCYMPEDRKDPGDRQHPLFEIIRVETPVRKPPVRPPPFTQYRIYGNNKEI